MTEVGETEVGDARIVFDVIGSSGSFGLRCFGLNPKSSDLMRLAISVGPCCAWREAFLMMRKGGGILSELEEGEDSSTGELCFLLLDKGEAE